MTRVTTRRPRAVVYARVSTKDQEPRTQLRQLRAYARDRGFQVTHELVDRESGAKDDRAGLEQLRGLARKRQLDVVLVWKFDRFARSTKQLIDALEDFGNLNVDFVSYTENIDTTGSMGKLVFTIFAGLAEFERSLIVQRVRAGLERARAEGTRLGRPPLDPALIEKIRTLRRQGLSVRAIAVRLQQSRSVVSKYTQNR
jgi:DNA invertase Pin-like site-specific DNA recombinase